MKLDAHTLQSFTGTTQWYRHGLNRKILFTDGAKYVADAAGAYWLLDTIAIAQQHNARVRAEAFQVWTLTVASDRSATLVCEDGDGHVVDTQRLSFTDFPLDQVALWVVNHVMLLPSEY